jgi:hypothetical protein
MAVLSSSLQVFIVLGIYNFGLNQAFFLEVDDYSEKSHGIIIFLGDFPTPTRFICYMPGHHIAQFLKAAHERTSSSKQGQKVDGALSFFFNV